MASDLQRKLDYILDEKANKIIPYNIRKGVEIFGVSGECVGVDSTDATATPADIREGKTAYVNDQKITGTFKGVETTDATATAEHILIGRSAYTAEGMTSGKMPNNGILNYTPKAENQDIPAGYTSGGTVKGDANLVAENIKKGTTIFGIEGQAEDEFTDHEEYDACLELANEIQTSVGEEDGWIDTSDATATAEDIIEGKVAYANGERIVGTLQSTSSLDTTLFTGTGYLFHKSEHTEFPLFDTSNVLKMDFMFQQCPNVKTVPLYDTSSAISMYRMFYQCTSLETVPQFNTEKVTNFTYMFDGCSNLVNVPEFDVSSIVWTGTGTVAFGSMFANCPKLSNESLNNILAMCIKMVNVTAQASKNLKYIGLSSAQATICQSLSNYQAFLDAGWTTGY